MKKYFLGLLLIFVSACAGQQTAEPKLNLPPIPSSWTEQATITLTNGYYSEAAAPGSASKIIIQATDYYAWGTLNQAKVLAIILTTSGGGSGTFYDLYLFTEEDGTLVYTAQTPLGDRIKINRMGVTDNEIKISLTDHKAGTGMGAEPDLPLVKSFVLIGKELQTAEQAVKTSPQPTPPPTTLVDKTLYWQSSVYNNDTQETPNQPEQYTITFHKDWTVTIHTDCQDTVGSFGLTGSKLSINLQESDSPCPEQSLGSIFIRDIKDATHIIFREDNVYIDLSYHRGSLILTYP